MRPVKFVHWISQEQTTEIQNSGRKRRTLSGEHVRFGVASQAGIGDPPTPPLDCVRMLLLCDHFGGAPVA